MKVSINLAQKYTSADLKSIPHEELLKRIGAQLGAVEDVEDWSAKYDGAVIVRVVSCEKHPDADRLNICRIDDGGKNQNVERGDDGLVQVVCGAPNVKSDMYAVWLAPGVIVPSSRDHEPFVLEARELRGVVSNGMLASASELGISDDHSGILEVLAEDALKYQISSIKYSQLEPGMALTELYGLDDFVIDCENKMFTHRPDCFGNMGVAREIAGIFGLKYENQDWYWKFPEFMDTDETLSITSKNEVQELVPRFVVVSMSDITVKPSPIWLQAQLTRVGIKSINNVVDVTNYVMHLTGQPLHAFDYDKIKARSENPGIFPRLSQKGEKLTLLGGKEIELTGEEVVISTDKQAVALAGIMGGLDTEVDENTKNILIECATFDMYSVRRSSMRHGLFTDAVTRFNKGQSPLQNDRVIWFAMEKMAELAGAKQASNVADIRSDSIETAYQNCSLSHELKIDPEFVSVRLGREFTADDIAELLRRVNFACVSTDDGKLEVTAPFWRTDIEIQEDIVEEVGRLYGYDSLPVGLPKRLSKPTQRNGLSDFKSELRQLLKERGGNEVLTYSFVHGDLLAKTGIDAESTSYHIRNAISPDLQYYRPSLLPSLLAKIHPNIKAQAGSADNQFALFEIGRTHLKSVTGDDLPKQFHKLALVVSADDKTAGANQSGSSFYLAKKYLESIGLGRFDYNANFEATISSSMLAERRRAQVTLNNQAIGEIGEISQSTKKQLKLPNFTAGFEIDIELLRDASANFGYKPLPPLPGTWQDYTVSAPVNKLWSEVYEEIDSSLESARSEGYRIDIKPMTIFEPEGANNRKISFRISMSHPDKTITADESNRIINLLK